MRVYDPKAKEKEGIRNFLLSQKRDIDFGHPRISFLFHMPIPASIPKKELPLYQSGLLKHEKKPDADNLVKLYLDCLDGIIIHGDQKVCLGSAVKVYHPEPKTIIWVNESSPLLCPWDLDTAYLSALEPEIPCFCASDFPCDSQSLWMKARSLSLHSSIPSPIHLA